MTDEVLTALDRIETALMNELNATINACRAYADHLASGGNPRSVASSRSDFGKAAKHSREILNAYRRSTGGIENPCSPSTLLTNSFELFDYLAVREGQFVSNAELQAQIDRGRYRFQVEPTLPDHVLRDAGWRLEKGKIDGKVAYRLVRVTEVATV